MGKEPKQAAIKGFLKFITTTNLKKITLTQEIQRLNYKEKKMEIQVRFDSKYTCGEKGRIS